MSLPFKMFLPLCLMACAVTMATADNNCKEILTFNAGLIPKLPEVDIRRANLIKQLESSSADFICLQEVWFEKDMSRILDDIEDRYPYHYSAIHADIGDLRPSTCDEPADAQLRETPCTAAETQTAGPLLIQCGNQQGCFSLPAIHQGLCIVTKCVHILRGNALSESCISCVVLQNPSTLLDALNECVTPRPVHNRLNQPGLLVLSKIPFKQNYTTFFPNNKMAFRRSYIEAELNDGKLAVCTHLSSIFPVYFEYDLPFNSFDNQSQAEINILNSTFANREHIIVGDLNVGPKISDPNPEKNLTGELADNYHLLTSMGYRSAYMEKDARCTFCRSNPFVPNNVNNVLDQVMVKTTSSFTTPMAKRVFDTTIPPLSDHYGVQVKVCDP